jgi:hypothetical protein
MIGEGTLYEHQQKVHHRSLSRQALSARCTLLEQALRRLDDTLRVPAAEYVPAIQDAFTIIDAAMKEITHGPVTLRPADVQAPDDSE